MNGSSVLQYSHERHYSFDGKRLCQGEKYARLWAVRTFIWGQYILGDIRMGDAWETSVSYATVPLCRSAEFEIYF